MALTHWAMARKFAMPWSFIFAGHVLCFSGTGAAQRQSGPIFCGRPPISHSTCKTSHLYVQVNIRLRTLVCAYSFLTYFALPRLFHPLHCSAVGKQHSSTPWRIVASPSFSASRLTAAVPALFIFPPRYLVVADLSYQGLCAYPLNACQCRPNRQISHLADSGLPKTRNNLLRITGKVVPSQTMCAMVYRRRLGYWSGSVGCWCCRLTQGH